MNFLKTISQLFTTPSIFLTLKDERKWWKGGLTLLFSMTLIYTIIFSLKLPSQFQKADQWISWFAKSIESINYNKSNEILLYKTTEKIPFSLEKEDFTLVVSDQNHVPIEHYKTARGAIFTPKEIIFWLSQANQKVIVPIIQDGKIMENVNTTDFFEETGTITANFFTTFAYSSIYIFSLATVFSNLIYIILTTLFIIFVRRLLNGKNNQYGFGAMFNLYCYIAIPPMTLAAIYSSLPNSSFDFSLTYMLSLFFFITFVIRKTLLSTYNQPPQP
jgi:hypothetical protein